MIYFMQWRGSSRSLQGNQPSPSEAVPPGRVELGVGVHRARQTSRRETSSADVGLSTDISLQIVTRSSTRVLRFYPLCRRDVTIWLRCLKCLSDAWQMPRVFITSSYISSLTWFCWDEIVEGSYFAAENCSFVVDRPISIITRIIAHV